MSWDERIIYKKNKREPELPEDCLFILLKKNPLLETFINHFDLQLGL